MFEELKIPRPIDIEVSKIDLTGLIPENKSFDIVQAQKLLVEINEDLSILHITNVQLRSQIETLEKLLAEKNDISRTFDIVWAEVFSHEFGPMIKDHFKKRLGI